MILISGGQSGVDRAALDAARDRDIERRAVDTRLPAADEKHFQSSMWLTMPSASFGSNQVDFGGMISPASATAIRSLICVG